MPPPVVPVQFTNFGSASGGSTNTVSVLTTTGQGNTLVVAVSTNASGSSPSGVTDTQGNAWIQLSTGAASPGTLAVFWCVSNQQLVAGTDTLTISFASPAGGAGNLAFGYDLGAGWSTDQVAEAGNSLATTQSVSTGTMTYGSELVLGLSWNTLTSPAPAWQAPMTLLANITGFSGGILLTSYALGQGTGAATVSTTTTLGTTGWVMIAVTFYQVVPALSRAPSVPLFQAGFGPAQADMQSLWVVPASFFQQRVVFRAAQLINTTTLPSSGAVTRIAFDTILEDPYSGWNSSTHFWSPPAGLSGWYQVTVIVGCQAPAATNVVLQPYVVGDAAGNIANNVGLTSIVLPTAACGAEGTWYVHMFGGQDSIGGAGSVTNSGSNVLTSTTLGGNSSIEVMWISS